MSHGGRPEDPAFRLIRVAAYAALVGGGASAAAFALQRLIALFTNVFWYGHLSTAPADDWNHHLPVVLAVLMPALGGLIVGFMARWGSPKIRGHGIPEVMESILTSESRIAPRVAILKPLSAAIAIGSGGPFGAEGPIIATGGAMGSVFGQLVTVSVAERKTLLAAGAAAGMSAMFGSPVAAVILAVELLLFEMRPRSLIPVSIASVLAYATSRLYSPVGPLFPLALTEQAGHPVPVLACALLGIPAGFAAIGVTKIVYWVEDGFERLPIHWMWWPSLGGLLVGLTALLEPRVLGVGYVNIGDALEGKLALAACASICVFKLVAWAISLGTGTSGGVLAPILTVGACLGAASGLALDRVAPGFSPGPGLAALAVMAAVFAGTARAPIATVVFALELTHRVEAFPAVLAAVAAAQLVTAALLEHSIMTERLARRGIPIGHEYAHDELSVIRVSQVMTREVLTVPALLPFEELVRWFAPDGLRTKHQGYPVVDTAGRLVGILTKKDAARARDRAPAVAGDLSSRPVVTCFEDEPLREAADRLGAAGVGRLVVVDRNDPGKVLGILSRSDIFEAKKRLSATNGRHPVDVAPVRLPVIETAP